MDRRVMRKYFSIAITILSFLPLTSLAANIPSNAHLLEFREASPDTSDIEERAVYKREFDKSRDLPDKPTISIGRYDLNDDGIADLFVYLVGKVICGASACPMQILLVHKDHSTTPILSVSSQSEVYVLDSSTNGFHDIAFPNSNPSGPTFFTVWKWTGKKYECCTTTKP